MNEAELRRRFEEVGADWEYSQDLLRRLNEGHLAAPTVQVASFPSLDGRQVMDLRGDGPWLVERQKAEASLRMLLPAHEIAKWLPAGPPQEHWDTPRLEALGLRLSTLTAFGVLNGGMATSYADIKKNQSFSSGLYQIFRPDFEAMASRVSGLPKGLTPAFIQPDQSAGPSYLELKFRALAQINMAARAQGFPGPGLQLFQMTSTSTHQALQNALAEYGQSETLRESLGFLPGPPAHVPTAVQNTVATFTSTKDGFPRKFFLVKRNGREVPYALPGGHGQNFRVLQGVYRQLLADGYRFVYLGNVDNLGYLPSLRGIALLALAGAPAAFDFAFRTPVDVKGGVLYRQPDGNLNCADIGVAIPAQAVADAEREGRSILFNCATGLFDLRQLVSKLDQIMDSLPVRVTEQDKDIGRYAQVEQVTWEVIGLLERPLIFGVEKNRRFLASKLLMDCFLTSGLHADDARFRQPELAPFRALSASLHAGLQALLEGPFGFRLNGKLWTPVTLAEQQRRLAASGFDRISV